MPIQTILVALALNDDSSRIAARALQLASQHNAQLVAVHVIEEHLFFDSLLPTSIDTTLFTDRLKEQHGQQLQTLLETAGKPAIIHVETGKAHDIIENLAIASKADLIIIGPGVAENLREKMFGSTADRVVRSAPCPVLLVRNKSSGPYQHIAVGVDFSEHAYAAVRCASRLSPAASRDIIHAFEIPLSFEQAMLKAGTTRLEIDRYRNAKATAARQLLMEKYSENGQLPNTTRIIIVQGTAATVLIHASHQKPVDLVALGTQGSNAVAQHILGSVARKVLLGTECDVLVVPASAL